jgi:dethiobiotin synthetase
MVPLNKRAYVLDLIQALNAEVILVVKHYLGSINHTLLSLELLKSKNIPVKGIIYNAGEDHYSEQAIVNHSNIEVIGRIPYCNDLTCEKIVDLGKLIDL